MNTVETGAAVVGAGLAGCESAWALANAGINVRLYEMKPHRFSPAHNNENFAELVCSNSLKAARVGSAAGMLKTEMRMLGSLAVECALQTRVAAGGALAVDRDAFAALVTRQITSHPLISVERREITGIAGLLSQGPVIVATGPLTSDALASDIGAYCGERLSFYDAAAPIVTADSLDYSRVFSAARYGRGDDDYINCPFNKEEYEAFYEALLGAQRARLHSFDTAEPNVYEGCMPIEIMARRGLDTIRYGPLKPVGLRDPRTGHRPWAVVQLRRENRDGTLYNLVGFQTNLKFEEQKRVFSMIPGLENAVFARYGVMHRNTFLDSPRLLDAGFGMRDVPGLWFAGQITGVEGYMESAMSGIIAGRQAARYIKGMEPLKLPMHSMCAALCDYISGGACGVFQPMGANMGLLAPLEERVRDKQLRYERVARRGLAALEAAMTQQQEAVNICESL